jgi:hypothetical protein
LWGPAGGCLRPYCDHASGHCEWGCDHLRPR